MFNFKKRKCLCGKKATKRHTIILNLCPVCFDDFMQLVNDFKKKHEVVK